MTAMIEGRRADSARRRERVLKALDAALRADEAITVASLARTARVDRTFLYRHRDLLERVHAAAAAPPAEGRQAAVSRASLQADLANALERNTRLQTLGQSAWADSGLGAPVDVDQLQRQITRLEQQLADARGELGERTDELDASRAANRELTRALNHGPRETR
ncbi:hypothetical protein GCM10010095_20040 [Streptomyces anthocyanicus]|uniref:DUF6262 family protein n=1 Tax=Streptomyces anthocyanicus TaxID=68174 RepID=UPI001670DF94|nr:DUF6262 family protein [Streptomyces anthocyanicus]GGL34700.1 hypothetical protein GCM10010095_20040 [Streptomyces anthocyanicus]